MSLVKIWNGAQPTTAALPQVTTGTAIKTMLQVLNAERKMRVKEWGVSFDGSAAAEGVQCELICTGIVAATVTAHAASGIVLYGDPDDVAVADMGFTLSTAGTGFTATAEGTITTTRLLDAQIIQPTNQYIIQMPLMEESVVDHDEVLRIRMHAPAAVNAICYVLLKV